MCFLADINFFGETLSQESKTKKKGFYITLIVLCLFIVTASMYILTEFMAADITRNISELKGYLSDIKVVEKMEAIEAKKRQIAILSEYGAVIEAIDADFSKNNMITSQLLLRINEAVPSHTTFNAISCTDDNITIMASSLNRTESAEFLHNLKALGIFEDVFMQSVQETDGTVTCLFTVNCTLKVKDVSGE